MFRPLSPGHHQVSILPDTEESTTPQIYQQQIRNVHLLKSF